MSEARRFRGVYSVLAYLPVVIPPVVAVLLWKTFYDAGPNGVFNTILGWVHLGPYPWLQAPDTAHAVARPRVDLGQRGRARSSSISPRSPGVNRELYEAAAVDGAGLWHKVWHITMPQLRGVLLVTLILQIIGTAQVFLEPYLFTSGGPINSTLTMLLLIYNYAFGNSLGGDYGAATALSLMLAALPRAVVARSTCAPRAPGARRDRVRRSASARTADSQRGRASRPHDWRRPGVRYGVGSAHVAAVRAARRHRPRADPVAGEGGDHADPGHPHPADGAVPARLRLGQPRQAWTSVQVGRYFWNTVVLAFGSWAVPDHRRDDRRVRAVGAAAEVRAGRHGPAADHPVRAGRGAAGAALHRDRAPAADPPLVHRQLLGDLAARRRERVQRHRW